ncbi:hypothetical protein MAR_017302 [Mya arenaria]|uniref:Uncharacterized protein n=1 Tax=Mya arenaria TaxID=6604 RepID=A0ABY7EE09_MYAAR|nr:uncharacterized protein LOC128238146 [Mya arenaria]WAR07344.1 hypothetical protein MAR_017302 [Mya arenaria]
MGSDRRPRVLAAGGLCWNSLGSLLSLLALGLPSWVAFHKTFDTVAIGVSSVVNTSSLTIDYSYGLWRYCSKTSTNTILSDTCADVATSTDGEQTTVCLLVLSIILQVNAAINTTFFFSLFRGANICLYVASVSYLGAEILSLIGLVVFGTGGHSRVINEHATLDFNAGNLRVSFWLVLVCCVCVIAALVLTILAIFYQRRISSVYGSKDNLLDVSTPEQSVEKQMLKEDEFDTDTKSASELHFTEKGVRTLYLEHGSDSEDEIGNVIFSKAPVSHDFLSDVNGLDEQKFGLKDKLRWRDGASPSEEQDTEVEDKDKGISADMSVEVKDSKHEQSDIEPKSKIEESDHKERTDEPGYVNIEELTKRIEANEAYMNEVGKIMQEIDDQEEEESDEEVPEEDMIFATMEDKESPAAKPRRSQQLGAKPKVKFHDLTPVESSPSSSMLEKLDRIEPIIVEPRTSTQMEDYPVHLDADYESEGEVMLVTSRTNKLDDDNVPPPAFYHLANEMDESAPKIKKLKTKKAFGAEGARPKTFKPKSRSIKKKKLKVTKERKRMLEAREDKFKAVEEIYGVPQVIIGTYVSHPAPRSLYHKKEPPEAVKKSAKRFMDTFKAYRTLRKKIDEEKQEEANKDK